MSAHASHLRFAGLRRLAVMAASTALSAVMAHGSTSATVRVPAGAIAPEGEASHAVAGASAGASGGALTAARAPDGDAAEATASQPAGAPASNGAQPGSGQRVAGLAASSPPRQVDSVPVYSTRIPPAFTFVYRMHRGFISGRGQLSMVVNPQGYEARLEGWVAGLSILDWNSHGAFDAAGFAPQRFTDKRLRRTARAANFQRDQNKITYSGPAVTYELPPGAQDRLSWMLQLAAVAQADPGRLRPGQHVTLFVTGARGDAAVWRFAVVAHEPVGTPLGQIRAVHLLREADRPRETRAEIWLDPSRHHLPVKARLSTPREDGAALELVIEESSIAGS